MRHLVRRRVLRTISRAGTAPPAATAGRTAATAPVPSLAWAAARRRSFGATACRPHAASGAAGLWAMWSRLTGSGEAQQTQESCANSADRRHVISTEVMAAGVGLNGQTLETLNRLENFSIMLQACEDSAEMRHVIGTEMPAARVEPNVVTFNQLVGQLMF